MASHGMLEDEGAFIEPALRDAGCKVKRVSYTWPRDSFVEINNKYVTIDFFEKSPHAHNLAKVSWFAQGGLVISGNDFVIASKYGIPKEKQEKYENALQKIYQERAFMIDPIQNIPLIGKNDHIDLTVGCIPEIKTITVDARQYEHSKEDFKRIEKETGFQVVPINVTGEENVHGNNYLVIEEQEKTVVANKGATRVNSELRNLGITVIETSKALELMLFTGGSVRCATNRLINESLLEHFKLYKKCGFDPIE